MTAPNPTAATGEADRYRLPRTVVPSHYDLVLEPDLGAATFTGTVAIDVEVVEPVDEIVLNALDLEIDRATLVGPNGTRLAGSVTYDADTERALIDIEDAAAPGRWRLELSFRGELNDKLVGFYRSTYVDEDGATQTLAVSQMESTHARRAFPCFDEPDFKATFAVTLVVADGLTALSNAAEIADEPTDDGRRRVRFATTMKMSTYLVAFVVGPLEVTEAVTTRGGVPIRVAHPRGKGHLAPYALDAAVFCLDFFADWFDIPYPGDKLDLVAVPDFAFGAMENLGCVTFREVLLLIDPESATQPELERLVDVVAHELAHMWFGDLVTMGWWEGIWLNEAFATFMEMLATDAYRPEWQRWVSFGLSRTAAFDVDALAATRPIEFPVISPEDAEGMFDLLTYEKGAAVLRMLEQYLGPDTFRDGIRRYISTHQYGNTVTTDLWDAIEESSGEPVRRIMDSWIYQGGFPAVGVDLEQDRHVVRLTQRRFQALDPKGSEPDATEWSVPVTLRVGRGDESTVERVLLEGDTTTVDLDRPADWVHVNVDGAGFYRVRYSPAAREALLAHRGQLAAIERYGLVDDAWAAVLADELDAPSFLALVRELAADEDDLSVWQRIAGGLGALDRLVPAPAREAWTATVRALARPALDRIGWEPAAAEDERHRQLRGTLVSLLGTVGADDEVVARSRALHDRHLAGEKGLDPALVAAAIEVVAGSGTAEDFDAFAGRVRAASTPQEEVRYTYALADFPGAEELDRLLAMTLTDEIRTQNGAFVLRRALLNRENGPQAWAFVQSHWSEISERLPSMSMVRMVEGVRALSTPELAAQVEAFFAEHPLPQATKTLAQHLEAMRVNVGVREREADRIAAAVTD
ncbi:M1 family metallopeptidase [Actinomarinicola tropica]|uniref:M1 family metallopeptidase n=1 Tax=Actinomarinicola tropica TaxID=2789776 RepID=UPI001898A8DC|nr:M1 family metallopeptidase [Actinomarinicola tropica]